MYKLIKISLLITSLSCCGIYSFSGASIPSEAKSFSVEYFKTSTSSAPSLLSRILTESLSDLIISQTNLDFVEFDGDLRFSGKISKYQITPISINSNESVGKNRLTISVFVKYENTFNDELSYEKSFSHYSDFESSDNFANVEENLIEEIKDVILENIFNKAFVNW